MSFLAKLNVDGKQYNILHCTYNFEQATDGSGKPAARPQGGQIMVTIEADGSYDLLHWMASSDQTKNGSVKFYKRDAMSRQEEVFFEKAYCTFLEAEFDAEDSAPFQKTIIISAKKLKIGDMTFENLWGE